MPISTVYEVFGCRSHLTRDGKITLCGFTMQPNTLRACWKERRGPYAYLPCPVCAEKRVLHAASAAPDGMLYVPCPADDTFCFETPRQDVSVARIYDALWHQFPHWRGDLLLTIRRLKDEARWSPLFGGVSL